jgi:hypothetical protein
VKNLSVIFSTAIAVRGVIIYIAFSTWLDPDESIFKSVARISCRSDTKASANNIAPIAPSLLLGRLNPISSWFLISLCFHTAAEYDAS